MHDDTETVRKGCMRPPGCFRKRIPHRAVRGDTQDGSQVIGTVPENLDAILAGQAVFLPVGVHRGEVLEWPNRAAC